MAYVLYNIATDIISKEIIYKKLADYNVDGLANKVVGMMYDGRDDTELLDIINTGVIVCIKVCLGMLMVPD